MLEKNIVAPAAVIVCAPVAKSSARPPSHAPEERHVVFTPSNPWHEDGERLASSILEPSYAIDVSANTPRCLEEVQRNPLARGTRPYRRAERLTLFGIALRNRMTRVPRPQGPHNIRRTLLDECRFALKA